MNCEANFTKGNYLISIIKEYKQNSILINCENKNDKKNYIAEYNSESIIKLFGKSLDEQFSLLYKIINDNNNYNIKEKNNKIIIKVDDKNQNFIIKLLLLKNDNSKTNTIINADKNNYESFSIDSLSSIQKGTESEKLINISNSNYYIQLYIPFYENLNNSYENDFKLLLYNSILLEEYKGKILNNLTGLLELCFLKKISLDLLKQNNMQKLLMPELMNILSKIDEYIHITSYSNRNLETMIKEKKIFNILSYSNYLKNLGDSVLDINILKHLLNLTYEKKTENEILWHYLLFFQEHNEHFEKAFTEDLKNCYFDYSLVSMNYVLSENLEENHKRNLEVKKKKILYHYSEIEPISKIFHERLGISNNLSQDEASFYDNFEFFSFNPKKNNKKEKRKIIPTDSTFSFIASEVFFKEESISISNESNLSDINENEIHLVTFPDENLKQKHKSLGYCYPIKEKSRIFPICTITLKRNEFFVLHMDTNFNKENEHSQFLRNIQNQNSNNIFDINIYYESSTEEALKFLLKRKYNKLILITNVGKNLEGKRFVNIVRKIFGFDVLVLFFSHNKNHLKWLKNYNNCLFTDNINYYNEFITNFNEKGLKNLKEKLEKELSIQFKIFTFDFILFSNYKSQGTFSSLNFKCEYLRQGYFKNGNNYLYMNKEGNISLEHKKCEWTLTLLDNEITLLSNGFYLGVIEDTDKVKGIKHMVIWGFDIKNRDQYNFFTKNNNNMNESILSVEGNEIKVTKTFPGKNIEENETFIFYDSLEEGKDYGSYLSDEIDNLEDTVSFNKNISL